VWGGAAVPRAETMVAARHAAAGAALGAASSVCTVHSEGAPHPLA
jgi:hypothetical protein